MTGKSSEIDALQAKATAWRPEFEALRDLLLDAGLSETLKWNKACYTLDGGNVAILMRLRDYAGLGFFKGSLLKDPAGIPHRQGQHSQAMRLVRVAGMDEIEVRRDAIRACIADAMEVERSGRQVEFGEKEHLELPQELEAAFAGNAALKAAFGALTPGRQRGYVLHFASARQSKTRADRIAKCSARILAGKGRNDR